MKIANTLLVLAALGMVSTDSWAFDNSKNFRKDTLEVFASTQYYYSQSNFNSSGTQQSLSSGNYYMLIDATFGGRYTLGSRAAFTLAGNVGNATSHSAVANRSNSSFNWVKLGAEYLAYSGAIDVIPEFFAIIPTDKVNFTSNDAVANSEGVTELHPRLTLQKTFGSVGMYGYAGFAYRDAGRSYLAPWGAGVFYQTTDSKFGAEIFGSQSITDDKDTSARVLRDNYNTNVMAGSVKFGALNPSIIDTNFFFKYGLNSKWSMQADAGIAVAGSNAANGWHVGALLQYAFDFSSSGKTEEYIPAQPNPVPRGKSEMYNSDPGVVDSRVHKFKEDTQDGVDQSLFKSKPMTPVSPEHKLQKQLDDTEMQIELKTKSGRRKKVR